MILQNLYTHDFLEKTFSEHRDGIDPENYRVGKIKDKILVWNPTNNQIMEYYFDDKPEKEWFDISDYFKFDGGEIIKDTYFINRDGVMYSKFSKRNLVIHKELYPIYGVNYKNTTGKRTAHSKRIMIHKILAKIFIPNINPESNMVVDHIDRDKYNYSLSNLRWVTIKENALNSKPRSKRTIERVYEAYSDFNRTNICFTITESEAISKGYIINTLNNISRSNGMDKPTYGYFWRSINAKIFKYFYKFGYTSIYSILEDSLWKESSVPGLQCHPLGVIKQTGSRGHHLSLGSLRANDNKYGKEYSVINFNGKQYTVHRIIAETFLNNNKPLEIGLEVDHISTDTLDNRVINLRIVTHKENMNNIITRKALSNRIVIDPKGKEFISVTECSKYYKVSRTLIYIWIKNPNSGFKFKNDK